VQGIGQHLYGPLTSHVAGEKRKMGGRKRLKRLGGEKNRDGKSCGASNGIEVKEARSNVRLRRGSKELCEMKWKWKKGNEKDQENGEDPEKMRNFKRCH